MVTHIDASAGEVAVYDFARLRVPLEFKSELAQTFATYAHPSGRWGSVRTSKQAFWSLMYFSAWLDENGHQPETVRALTPGVWREFRIATMNGTSSTLRALAQSRMILRATGRLSAETQSEVFRRIKRDVPQEGSYSDKELREVTVAARRVFRAARARIRANMRHLARFREGLFLPDTDEHRIGEALEILQATGDLPRRWNQKKDKPIFRVYRQILGGGSPEDSWKRLYLSEAEVFAALVLLACKEGWNATSIAELNLPTQVDGRALTSGTSLYRVELEKRRRRPPHRYETRTLEDTGADSTARLLNQIVEITQPARDVLALNGLGTERLLVFRRFATERHVSDLFRTGIGDNARTRFQARTGVRVNTRRIRKAVNTRHRREPNQNTQNTHDSVYAVSDPHVVAASEEVIARGVGRAIEHAERFLPKVQEKDSNEGEETPTANCHDRRASPFSPWGVECQASFLLCLACSNAVVMPKHLGKLAYLYESLANLKQSLPAEVWGHEWARHYSRLHSLRTQHYSEAEWERAYDAVTDLDKATIRHLLAGDLDV